ncbi:MAG: HAMP domain-containing histidine kinase [Candidatus Moranbacteria bacterium]|nr:HAMP domain-containing histidine kinase [Candidatus Moranbacteria bacterium]
MKRLPSLRKHSVVAYAVLLVVAVTAAIFWNSYYSLRRFESSTDALLLSKARLAEEVFGTLSSDYLASPERLQAKVGELGSGERDVAAIVVFRRAEDGEGFRVVASTDPEDVGSVRSELPFMLAWEEEAGSAFLTNDAGGRYWNIVKRIDADSEKAGLVFFRFSLAENDAYVRSAVNRVYGVTFVTLIPVLLLLLHHLRFSRYAIRALELEEVDRMKDDFISMASHELRSPMTVIRGYVDLLTSGCTPEEAREYIGKIEATTERLSQLVDDLLDVSRLEQGRLPIDPIRTDLGGILEALADDYGIIAKEKGLVFGYGRSDTPPVLADPERVKQILVNLLSNAVKYTPEGSVTLSAKEDGDRVVVTVADTGLGISAESLRDLFAKFYRVRTEGTAEISGTGLGLWISREIARRMGGDIEAESIEGVGSHFSLSLPKADRT